MLLTGTLVRVGRRTGFTSFVEQEQVLAKLQQELCR